MYASAILFSSSLPIKHGIASAVSPNHSPPQSANRTLADSERSCSAKQYAEFGADIQHFARNLQKLGQVIGDVIEQVPAPLSREDHTWDLRSLLQICGDFRITLNECRRILEDSAMFERGRGNFIYNIRWNLSLEHQVAVLRDCLVFHNIKVKISP